MEEKTLYIKILWKQPKQYLERNLDQQVCIYEKNKGLKLVSLVSSTLRNQKKEASENKTKRKKGIIKTRAKVNEIENRKNNKKMRKLKASS